MPGVLPSPGFLWYHYSVFLCKQMFMMIRHKNHTGDKKDTLTADDQPHLKGQQKGVCRYEGIRDE